MSMKILIVDDEKPARERLKDLVLELNAGHELLEAANGLDALRITEEEQPDVVMLDIRMPIMDGLEAARHMALLTPPPAVLFTTAYDEHALKAFDANAIDYLLKPIRLERLQTALERARVIQRGRLTALQDHARMRTHIGAMIQGKLQLIPVPEIRYFKAEQKYVTVYWPGHEALIDDSLRLIEEEFGNLFLRIHRNALVAVAHIESLEKGEDGTYLISLRDAPEKLSVSRRLGREVKQRLKELAGR
jgi:two-component system response regulator AlgR